MSKFKIGDRVEYLEDGKQIDSGIICNAPEGSSSRTLGKVWAIWDSAPSMPLWCDESEVRLSDKDNPALPSSFKIDVQAYADENNISLEQAHNEIQPWLFEKGYAWSIGPRIYKENEAAFLEMGVETPCCITQVPIDWLSFCTVAEDAREITLSRKVTVELTPSFVESEKPAVEYVELGGKKYIKKELEEALSKIKAVEE
jgi:hypothetical protein